LAAKYNEGQVKADADNVGAYMSWAAACQLQGDFAQVEAILLRGLRRHPDNQGLRSALSTYYIIQSDRLVKASDPRLRERLELVEQALVYSPNHPAALVRLAAFVADEGTVGESARASLNQILAEGRATATVHLILGTRAITHGDLQKAKLHLEQAHELNPSMPVLLNNLAWLLANQSQPQLERALGFANQALKIAPNDPRIRETRGQICAKLGRWQEALVDLEFALPQMSGDRELHQTLSLVYQELGEDDIAREHRRRSQGTDTPSE